MTSGQASADRHAAAPCRGVACRYAKRPRVVADASVVIALLFEERQWEEAAERLRGRLISAPHLLDLEVANAALRKMRREGRDAANALIRCAATFASAGDLGQFRRGKLELHGRSVGLCRRRAIPQTTAPGRKQKGPAVQAGPSF